MIPRTQAWAMLSSGPDQIVIIYVPRAYTKKNLENIPPIILFLGHIFLVFGYFWRFWPYEAVGAKKKEILH